MQMQMIVTKEQIFDIVTYLNYFVRELNLTFCVL